MSQGDIKEILATPELARLNQRNRLRQKIDPLNEVDVSNYIEHCIAEAGGDFGSIFAEGVADIVFRCSEGVPRIINTLCETALMAAAEDGLQQVTVDLMRHVAADAFGFEQTQLNEIPSDADAQKAQSDHGQEPVDDEQTAEPDTAAETDAAVAGGPDQAATDEPDLSASDAFLIPDLINDTQPVLQQIEDEAAQSLPVESAEMRASPSLSANDDADPSDTAEGQ